MTPTHTSVRQAKKERIGSIGKATNWQPLADGVAQIEDRQIV